MHQELYRGAVLAEGYSLHDDEVSMSPLVELSHSSDDMTDLTPSSDIKVEFHINAYQKTR